MKNMLVTVGLSACLLLAIADTAQAQLPVRNYYNTSPYVANNMAYRNAMSRTSRVGVQSNRGSGAVTNYGLGTLTTGVNSLMMLNGMIPGASAYSNQGYNNQYQYQNQGYDPYMYQGYNPYMMNPYMMNPYGNYGMYP